MHAPLFDPGGIDGPGHSGDALLVGSSMLPSAFSNGVGSRLQDVVSGLYHAACMLAVYASRPGLPSVAAQDSLPAGGPPWPGRDLNPLGPSVKFQPHPLHGVLLTQAFLAHSGTPSQP